MAPPDWLQYRAVNGRNRDLGVGPISIPGYVIERELGVGGMARVYLAIQTSLERRVALKVMAAALAADASFSKRFLREARTIAALTHPNIVAVYEVGVTPDHLHYFSMQFLPGGDFAQRMRRGVEQSEIVRVLSGIGKALGFAHQQGVVHRDVTPSNVMFDASDTPQLTDFGIARALSGSTRITSTGVSIGTSNYMSPEQARGGEIDARSDLYSLGALVFEALTGRPPYQGPDGFAVAYAHVFEPIPRLPPELRHWQAFVDKALAKDPKDRFLNADEFIAGLQAVPPTSDTHAPMVQLPQTPTQRESLPVERNSSTAVYDNLARQLGPTPPLQTPSWPRWILLLILAGGLSAIGYGVWSQRKLDVVPAPVAAPAQPLAPPKETPLLAGDKPAPAAADVPTAPPAVDALSDTDTPPTVDGMDPSAALDPNAAPLEGVPAPLASDFGPPTPAERIQALLDLGQTLLRMQRLQLPPEANAALMYTRVLTLEPDNEVARKGLEAVVDAYLQLAIVDLDAMRLTEGKDRLERARQVAATPGLNTPVLVKRIDDQWKGRIDALRETARQALAQWRGPDAEQAINQALQFVPDDKELKSWLREAKAIGKPGYVFRDAAASPELIIVGPGDVLLTGTRRGNDVRVNIASAFAVGRQEVTVGEFRRFIDATRYTVTREGCRNREGFFSSSKERTWRDPGFKQGDDHPVVCMGYPDAAAYAKWLSETTGKRYRLLSEAEWQYLARKVTVKPCASGNRADQSYKKSEGGSGSLSCDDGAVHTAPVRRFEASAPGIYDIEGNVREWVADCGNDTHSGRALDQKARSSGSCDERMVMGSSWYSDSDEAAVIVRRAEDRDWLSNTTGFRIARELDAAAGTP